MRIQISIQRNGPSFADVAKVERDALALAINRSLEEAQDAERKVVAANFIDRRGRSLLRNMIKISAADRATSSRLIGRLRIAGPEGSEGISSLLTRHEEGGPRTTGTGGSSIDPSYRIKGFFYIPTPAIRSPFSATVPRKIYPSSLHITERKDVVGVQPARVHRTRHGILQLKGDDRTFVLFGANGGQPIGIFQRSGRSKWGGRGKSAGRVSRGFGRSETFRDDIRLIWSFKQRITLKPRLHFYETVPQTVAARIGVNYSGFVALKLRSVSK